MERKMESGKILMDVKSYIQVHPSSRAAPARS